MRVKVTPKTSSQSAGWTVRTRMSVGSCTQLAHLPLGDGEGLGNKSGGLAYGTCPVALRAGCWEAAR